MYREGQAHTRPTEAMSRLSVRPCSGAVTDGSSPTSKFRRARKVASAFSINKGAGSFMDGSLREESTEEIKKDIPNAVTSKKSPSLARKHSLSAGSIFRMIGRTHRKQATQAHQETERQAWSGATKLIRDLGDTVTSVAISEDDMYFAAGGTNKMANVYSTANGALVASFTLPHGLNAIAFFDLGQDECQETLLFCGTFGGLVYAAHVNDQRLLGECRFADGDSVHSLGLAKSDGSNFGNTSGRPWEGILVVGGNTSVICVYSVKKLPDANGVDCVEFAEVARLSAAGVVRTLVIDEIGSTLITGGDSKIVQLWDLDQLPLAALHGRSLTPDQEFTCATTIHCLSLTCTGDLLAVGTSDHVEVYEINRISASVSNSAAARPGILRKDRPLHSTIKSLQNMGSPQTHPTPKPKTLSFQPVTWFNCPAHQGGVSITKGTQHSMLAIGGNQLLSVYSISSGGAIRKMPREGRVRCVALSRDGSLLVAGGFDRKVSLNVIEDGTHMFHFNGEQGAEVKSVHLSSNSTRLAIGYALGGKGYAELYDSNTNQRIASFEHKKPVWCVRISPDGQILLAAGYDGKLSVYDTWRGGMVQQITYPAKGGPNFIWTLAFSHDGRTAALGCWNGSAYLYRLNRAQEMWRSVRSFCALKSCDFAAHQLPLRGSSSSIQASGPLPETNRLLEVAQVRRSDRVYAVALDESGQYMAVGGRDKAVVLYALDSAPQESRAANRAGMGGGVGRIVWETASEDFIYTVALTPDLQYCAYGGTAKQVHLCDGRTGVQLMRLSAPGTIWSVGLLQEPPRLVYGGECSTLTVVDLEQSRNELQFPVHEVVYSISLTSDSICFTNGSYGSMYGKPGIQYSWQDQPSYVVVSQMVMQMLSNEEDLLTCLSLIMVKHPSTVNVRDRLLGTSLLQFVVRECNMPRVAEMMLRAECRIGLTPDKRGATALLTAIRQGKWKSLQLLLDALLEGRLTLSAESMGLVMQCFESLAAKYPRELLRLVQQMPLEAEPEVMTESSQDVMLPQLLVAGSDLRCPCGIWEQKIAPFRVHRPQHEATGSESLRVEVEEPSKKASAHLEAAERWLARPKSVLISLGECAVSRRNALSRDLAVDDASVEEGYLHRQSSMRVRLRRTATSVASLTCTCGGVRAPRSRYLRTRRSTAKELATGGAPQLSSTQLPRRSSSDLGVRRMSSLFAQLTKSASSTSDKKKSDLDR